MSESTKVEVKPWSKKDTLNVLGGGALGILSLFGIGKVVSKVGDAIEQGQQEQAMDRRNEILAHQAKVLETDNNLGVKNAIASFQVECKGQKLSTFVFTDLDESGFPKVFTEYKGETVELLKDRTDKDDVNWYIPGTDVPEGEKGLKGIVGAEYVLMHQDKYEGNNNSLVRYWPPSDGKGQSVGFNYETEIAYRFDASELPKKVQGLLFGELR